MPGEWQRYPVSELIEQGALVIGDGYRAKNTELSRCGLPFARAQNIDAGFDFEGADCFPEEALAKVGNKMSQPGDVVFTSKGTVGRFAFVRPDTPRFVYSPQLCFWRSLDHCRLVPHWLFYWMQGREFFEQYKGVAGQTDMADYVSLRDQRGMSITAPGPDNQRAIAHILGTLDDKIEVNRRLGETLEAMARAIFTSWFVDFDPVRAKSSGEAPDAICRRLRLTPDLLALFPDRFQDSELGEIPERWEASTLAEQAERCGGVIQTGPFGSQLHASDYLAGGVPVVMPQDMQNRRVCTTRVARIAEEDASRLSRHRLQPGDVVYSRRGDVERHAVITVREAGWLCGTGCLLVRLGPAWPSPTYLSLALDQPLTRNWISRHAVGATMPNLNTAILGNVPMLLPSDSLIRAFDASVSVLAGERNALDLEGESLASLRDTLLPKLISGELRVAIDGPVSTNGQEEMSC
jgi:type I restriction enzyme S subunit